MKSWLISAKYEFSLARGRRVVGPEDERKPVFIWLQELVGTWVILVYRRFRQILLSLGRKLVVDASIAKVPAIRFRVAPPPGPSVGRFRCNVLFAFFPGATRSSSSSAESVSSHSTSPPPPPLPAHPLAHASLLDPRAVLSSRCVLYCAASLPSVDRPHSAVLTASCLVADGYAPCTPASARAKASCPSSRTRSSPTWRPPASRAGCVARSTAGRGSCPRTTWSRCPD